MPQITLTTITPRPLNVGAMRAQLLLGLKTLGVEIREDFKATVDDWNDKPTFEPYGIDPVVRGDVATVETTTVDKVYRWIAKGTKAHSIVPVNYPFLIFPSVFSTKNIPGTIRSNPGFSGPPMEFRGAEGVWHPGVEPRRFDELIKDKQEKNAKNIMALAMVQARQASRHAYP